MEINIAVRTLKAAIAALGDKASELGYASWRYQGLKSNQTATIKLDELSVESLSILRDQMKAHDEDQTRQVSKLLNSLQDVDNKSVPSLIEFPRFLDTYLKASGTPLLHSLHKDLRGVAYLPVSCKYRAAERHSEAYVSLSLAYNTKMRYNEYRITLKASDMRASVPAILRAHNLMVPDESMTEEYVKILARFEKFGRQQAEQFWCRGEATVQKGGSSYWWAESTLDMTYMGKPTKAVVDLGASEYGDRASAYANSDIYNKRCLVPTHPVLSVFSLSHHKMVWVNVCNMKEYKYEEGLKDKLVLPKSHVRLVSALVSNLDALRGENEAEDRSRTIRAKASSSIILAKGPPGTGKTLTAEVYAEEIKRPLYEVQSGQIGTEPEQIEERLQEILNRSLRLRIPLVINEADVFIQKRGKDLIQNAVVAVFLRLLEYHTGLVFLTTNRADDIDDAVLSRCIAEISYGIPSPGERLKLWEIMLAEFNIELSKGEVRNAVLAFPTVVGRDIQNLIRLTNRVCTAVGEPFTLQALKDNAVFRSIKVLSDAELEAAKDKLRKANGG